MDEGGLLYCLKWNLPSLEEERERTTVGSHTNHCAFAPLRLGYGAMRFIVFKVTFIFIISHKPTTKVFVSVLCLGVTLFFFFLSDLYSTVMGGMSCRAAGLSFNPGSAT